MTTQLDVAFFASRTEEDGSLLTMTQFGKCVRLSPAAAQILKDLRDGLSPEAVSARLATSLEISGVQAEELVRTAIDQLAIAGFFVE